MTATATTTPADARHRARRLEDELAEHREAWAEVLDAVARADREPLETDRLNALAVAAWRARQLAAHYAGREAP